MKTKFIILFLIVSFSFFGLHLCNAQVSLEPPIPPDTAKNPNILIGTIINAILGLVGSLSLLMFVYGGMTWIMSAGNKEKIQKGKDILIWATIGLIIIFTAYASIKFIFTGLGVS